MVEGVSKRPPAAEAVWFIYFKLSKSFTVFGSKSEAVNLCDWYTKNKQTKKIIIIMIKKNVLSTAAISTGAIKASPHARSQLFYAHKSYSFVISLIIHKSELLILVYIYEPCNGMHKS